MGSKDPVAWANLGFVLVSVIGDSDDLCHGWFDDDPGWEAGEVASPEPHAVLGDGLKLELTAVFENLLELVVVVQLNQLVLPLLVGEFVDHAEVLGALHPQLVEIILLITLTKLHLGEGEAAVEFVDQSVVANVKPELARRQMHQFFIPL